MEISKNFDSKTLESKWYAFWMENNYFNSVPNNKPPYTIVIPPPNVTGILHMGHMLNNTIQDILIRKARLQGFNACWIPGTDHASIATEAKVVNKLKSQGINKSELSRNEFLKHAWNWTDEHGGLILEQLKILGCSCDWSRTKFTLDDDMSESVIKVFVELYNKGLIYKGYRMVNWDPEALTTLSNEEVIHEEVNSKLYYINYKIVGANDSISVATTRPETIFGDTAIAINPNDERYTHLNGKKVIIPIVNKEIPIIFDDYVEMDFGTGCLKVTPAHSENDKVIGDKHKLEFIDVFNDDATLNNHGLHYNGLDRFIVRSKISKELDEVGALVQTKNHVNKVGKSERTKCIIEPKLSEQWFLKMEKISKPALKVVMEDEVKLFPKKFKNTYKNWMENVRDWNISRQLWWGHQIPVYYFGDNKSDYVVAESKDLALNEAIKKTKNSNLTLDDLVQEEDVLDTWFSSWIWPISVLDGIRNPENSDFKYYYPTNDLVTGPDILFFWVARMIVSGLEFKNTKPFNSVYFTGLVRDKQGRKMSKQLGNSPDAVNLIKDFGADSVRVGLLLSAPAGNDLLFDESLCQQGKNFSNKVWNSFRLISSWTISDKLNQSEHSKVGIEWFDEKFNLKLIEIEDHFDKYRISDALMTIYKLVWDDLCSWYLEIVKPGFEQPIDRITYNQTISFFKKCITIMHPFMPFITEEIWSNIKSDVESPLIISDWPKSKKVNESIIDEFENLTDLISGIRKYRKEKSISFKNNLILFSKVSFDDKENAVLLKLANTEIINDFSKKLDNSSSFIVGSNEFHFNNSSDDKEDFSKIEQDLDYNLGFLKSIQAKLNNKRFTDNAPKNVLENELKKQKDTLSKIDILKNKLKNN
ncbi:valine--tRNA ligase [Flavobacteriaceae bacterium]|nr:valine--tRNA ligase [Flavobacteriaceae bacterium]MDB4086087.1 valine--tRNA ligase [Flavobacteriaceae bacterium]MDB4239583.1 valine--tRNA ligase [Flavobacteriaceae bacterium]MDB9787859.1 valine--tRNA ligase [Flavobacteriaceae bacterium]